MLRYMPIVKAEDGVQNYVYIDNYIVLHIYAVFIKKKGIRIFMLKK